jgi:hypothetical protein
VRYSTVDCRSRTERRARRSINAGQHRGQDLGSSQVSRYGDVTRVAASRCRAHSVTTIFPVDVASRLQCYRVADLRDREGRG